jgi:predicted metal-dependent enzyme (double-stranded beta helix superfamily)
VKPFSELGTLVESRWRDKNYDENFFPEIAARALSESGLIDCVDPWEIIRWVHQSPALPQQMDLPAKFADPPITLYAAPRFHIDAYYWLDGTTEIHQHAFSGAFQVLRGSSVHASYRFQVEQEINPHFWWASLRFATYQYLTVVTSVR